MRSFFILFSLCPFWAVAQDLESYKSAIKPMNIIMKLPEDYKEVQFKLSCNDGKLGNSILYGIQTITGVKIGMSYVDIQVPYKQAKLDHNNARIASLDSNYIRTARLLADSVYHDIIFYGMNNAKKMYNADAVWEFSRNCTNLDGYNRILIIAKKGVGHIELTYWGINKDAVQKEICNSRKLLSFKNID